jgi:hypothetical protein
MKEQCIHTGTIVTYVFAAWGQALDQLGIELARYLH